MGQILREDHRYINVSDGDDLAIWEAFCKYNDKKWSYTDCSILVMAHRLQIWLFRTCHVKLKKKQTIIADQ